MFLPWEESAEYIRSGHRSSDEFDKGSLRTIVISKEKGIMAIVGCPKGHFHDERCEAGMNVLSFLFAKENGWSMSKAKEWFEENQK